MPCGRGSVAFAPPRTPGSCESPRRWHRRQLSFATSSRDDQVAKGIDLETLISVENNRTRSITDDSGTADPLPNAEPLPIVEREVNKGGAGHVVGTTNTG